MKLRTAKKIMWSKKYSNRYKLIAVEDGKIFIPYPRYNDLHRRAQTRLRIYFWKYLLRRPKPPVCEAENPDGYFLGVPFYKGCRPPRHPIPKNIPVHKWGFTYKNHYFGGQPKSSPSVKSVSSVGHKKKDL